MMFLSVSSTCRVLFECLSLVLIMLVYLSLPAFVVCVIPCLLPRMRPAVKLWFCVCVCVCVCVWLCVVWCVFVLLGVWLCGCVCVCVCVFTPVSSLKCEIRPSLLPFAGKQTEVKGTRMCSMVQKRVQDKNTCWWKTLRKSGRERER